MLARAKSGPSTAELLRHWRGRLQHLEQLLRVAPDDQWSWLWSMRARIIRFLLSRYDRRQLEEAGIFRDLERDPASTESSCEVAPSQPSESKESYTAYEKSVVPKIPRGMGRPIRSSAAIRQLAASLEQLNEQRHESAQFQRQRTLEFEWLQLEEARQLWRKQTHGAAQACGRQSHIGSWQVRLQTLTLTWAAGMATTLVAFAGLLLLDFSEDALRQAISMPGLILALVLGPIITLLAAAKWIRVRRVIRRRERRWSDMQMPEA